MIQLLNTYGQISTLVGLGLSIIMMVVLVVLSLVTAFSKKERDFPIETLGLILCGMIIWVVVNVVVTGIAVAALQQGAR